MTSANEPDVGYLEEFYKYNFLHRLTSFFYFKITYSDAVYLNTALIIY